MTAPRLIKLGDRYINLDRVNTIMDLYPTTRENQLAIHFGGADVQPLTFRGQDADNLRTWLNSIAQDLTHLHVDNES